MGWISSDNEHEGWAAPEAPDGRHSGSSSSAGMHVKGITGRWPRDPQLDGYEIVPDKDIIGWRGVCECGWRGELWERAQSLAAADLHRRRDYVAPEDFADASPQVEDAIHEEWKAHIAPSEAVLGVEAAARDHKQAGARLDKTVAAARAAGASWADIGRAAGISRQSAHERWSTQ